MHELSIAMCLIDRAAEAARHHRAARVNAIHVRVGPLSGVVVSALESAYELAREGSPFAETRLVIDVVDVTVFCPTCQEARQVESIQSMCCIVCGTPTPDIMTGRELEITAMEIVDEPTHATR